MGFVVRSALIGLNPVVSLAFLAPADAASFDCAKAAAQIEIVICSDATLNGLDSSLGSEMKSAVARQRDQRASLLANQRAWLRTRDEACRAVVGATPANRKRAVDCLSVIYAERIAELKTTRPGPIEKSTFEKDSPTRDADEHLDGRWTATFPCLLSENECDGRSDAFSIDLWSSDSHLCGSHIATSHLGNQVDENDGDFPSIVGAINGPTATVAFKSSWGGSGHAKVTKIDNHLYWRILDDDGAINWFPHDAVLTKQRQPVKAVPPCDATRPESKGG